MKGHAAISDLALRQVWTMYFRGDSSAATQVLMVERRCKLSRCSAVAVGSTSSRIYSNSFVLPSCHRRHRLARKGSSNDTGLQVPKHESRVVLVHCRQASLSSFSAFAHWR